MASYQVFSNQGRLKKKSNYSYIAGIKSGKKIFILNHDNSITIKRAVQNMSHK